MPTVADQNLGPSPLLLIKARRKRFFLLHNKKVVNELNTDCGTASMVCSCNSMRYKYESCGHDVTGDLSIIKDIKLRNLISKGPAY